MNLQTRIFKHHCEASRQLNAKKLVEQEDDPSAVSEEAGAVEVVLNHPVVCEHLEDCEKRKATHDLSPPTPPQPATTKSTFIRDDANDDGKGFSFLRESVPETSTSTSGQHLYVLHSYRDETSNSFALQHKRFGALMTTNERENTTVPDTYAQLLNFGNEAAPHKATELLLAPQQYCSDTVIDPRLTKAKLEKIEGISVLVPGTVDVQRPLGESGRGCFQYISEATSPHSKTVPEIAGVSGRHIVIALEASPLPAPAAVQEDVCLDLNIGPGRVKNRKTSSAIHNERRINGLSTRWRRSEPENVAEARSSSKMPYWLKNLDVENVLKSEAFGSTLPNPNYSMAPLRLAPTAAAVISHTVSRELEKTRLEDDRWMRDCDLKCNLGLFLGATSGTAEACNDRMEISSSDRREPPTHPLVRLPEKTALIIDSETSSKPLPHWLGKEFAKPSEPATANMLQTAFPIHVKSHNFAANRHKNTVSGTLWCSAEPNPEIKESFQLEQTESLRGNRPESDVPHCSQSARMQADEPSSESFDMNLGLNYLNFQVLSKMPMEIPSVHEKALVEFLRAKKQHMEHFLDKIVVNVDVYQRHPWHYTWGDVRGSLYFCCITKYSRRGNMTRDRMTKEGGRWKQQGMVQPILTAKGYDPASKTYLSYIPCGKNNSKGYYIPTTPGRVKHRHRMIEIALDEDLKSEKRYLKLKVTPKPFLVVCVLRKALNL